MNGAFMIGCGGSYTPQYEVRDNAALSNTGSNEQVFRYGFKPEWIGRNIRAFNIWMAVRFHQDSNQWIKNWNLRDGMPRSALKNPPYELMLADAIPAGGLDTNSVYGFQNVSRNSKFWLWEWVDDEGTISRNKFRAQGSKYMRFQCILNWDTTQNFIEFRVKDVEILNIGWQPIF